MASSHHIRPPLQAILFDWDNTLVDSWGSIHQAMNGLMRRFDMKEWSLEDVKARSRESSRESFPRLFGERAGEAVKVYLEEFTAVHLDNFCPLNGAAELLACLTRLALPSAVISNKTSKLLGKEIHHAGWQDYFLSYTGAGEAEQDKPHQAIGDKALAKMPSLHAIERQKIGYVGDTGLDMVFAHRMGFVGIMIGTPHEILTAERMPDWHFADLPALQNWLENR